MSKNYEIMMQKQEWSRKTLYLLYTPVASVQMEFYPESEIINGYRVDCYISHLWVDKDFRKLGLASALLRKCEEIAEEHNVDYAYLEWFERDTPREVMDKLYIQRGYDDVCFGRDSALLRKPICEEE